MQNYYFLGSKITIDAIDIINKISQGKVLFENKNHSSITNVMILDTRKNFLKIYVSSVTLYGCETWTLSAIEKKKREKFEMWCYRKMLKIS